MTWRLYTVAGLSISTLFSNLIGRMARNTRQLVKTGHNRRWDASRFLVGSTDLKKKCCSKASWVVTRYKWTWHEWSQSWQTVHTVLANIHADGVNVGEVDRGGPHGGTGRPHIVKEEDWHSGEAKHTEPGHTQNVCEEHKLMKRCSVQNSV